MFNSPVVSVKPLQILFWTRPFGFTDYTFQNTVQFKIYIGLEIKTDRGGMLKTGN